MKYFTIMPQKNGKFLYKEWVPYSCSGKYSWFWEKLYRIEVWIYGKMKYKKIH